MEPRVRDLAARLVGIGFKSLSPVKREDLLESLLVKIEGTSQGKAFDAKDGSISGSGEPEECHMG